MGRLSPRWIDIVEIGGKGVSILVIILKGLVELVLISVGRVLMIMNVDGADPKKMNGKNSKGKRKEISRHLKKKITRIRDI